MREIMVEAMISITITINRNIRKEKSKSILTISRKYLRYVRYSYYPIDQSEMSPNTVKYSTWVLVQSISTNSAHGTE